jgi:hypothetical protein
MRQDLLASSAIAAVLAFGEVGAESRPTVQRMYTGGVMLSHCVDDSPYLPVCFGYLSGVYDMHGVIAGPTADRYFCAGRTNAVELRDLFVEYVSEDPRRVDLAAASLALNAFRRAYPCE